MVASELKHLLVRLFVICTTAAAAATTTAEESSVPLGKPTIRQWELDGNSTRYDRLQAAPSDDDLVIMWSLWAPISGLIAIFIMVVLLAILTNRQARKNPFNLYLVYLMIPDIIFSACCAITCALNASLGSYWSVRQCQWQSFYLTFGIAGNSWLNLAIARELHLLLQSSVNLRKYQMPTVRQVTTKAMAVYVYSAFVASMGIWGSEVSWLPHQTVSISGLGCFPLEYSLASSLFYFLVYIPLVAGIPIGYVIYICYDMWKRKLMPPAGKRRLLSIYFLRVVAAYVLMWMPHLVLCLAGTGYAWAVFAGGTWGHFQGVVSAGLSLTKPDVYQAVRKFLRCQCQQQSDPNMDSRRSRRRRLSEVSTRASARMLWPRRSSLNNDGSSSMHISGFDVAGDSPPRPTSSAVSQHDVGRDEYLPRQRDDFTFEDEEPASAPPPQQQQTTDQPVPVSSPLSASFAAAHEERGKLQNDEASSSNTRDEEEGQAEECPKETPTFSPRALRSALKEGLDSM